MAQTARNRGTALSAERFDQMSDEAAQAARLIHDLLGRVDVRLLGAAMADRPAAPAG